MVSVVVGMREQLLSSKAGECFMEKRSLISSWSSEVISGREIPSSSSPPSSWWLPSGRNGQATEMLPCVEVDCSSGELHVIGIRQSRLKILKVDDTKNCLTYSGEVHFRVVAGPQERRPSLLINLDKKISLRLVGELFMRDLFQIGVDHAPV